MDKHVTLWWKVEGRVGGVGVGWFWGWWGTIYETHLFKTEYSQVLFHVFRTFASNLPSYFFLFVQ